MAPIINESISKSVWQEGTEQATEMLDFYTTQQGHAAENGSAGGKKVSGRMGTTDESVEGLRRIAINVLGAVGYGKPQSWGAGEGTAPEGHKMSHMESLFAIISNFAASVMIPPWLMCLPIFPAQVQRIGVAVKEYPVHTKKMVAHQRATADATKNDLMSVMVRLSDQEKKQQQNEKEKSVKTRLYLTEEEISGNLFLFTLAGYDTTANTMAYALTNLAAFPKWQDWIIEEIDRVMPSSDLKTDRGIPAYNQTFPHLKRVLALMMETMRLYTPLPRLSRTTKAPITLTSASGTQHRIPPGIDVFVNLSCLHTDPKVWGPDALVFRPSRWIVSGADDTEQLLEPAKGTFTPWSIGPKYCPGMKVSQVEFVSVFATLFGRARVEAAPHGGMKSQEEARERLEAVMADSQTLIALQMNRPRKVVLRWVRRD